jgi:hypothetical protein
MLDLGHVSVTCSVDSSRYPGAHRCTGVCFFVGVLYAGTSTVGIVAIAMWNAAILRVAEQGRVHARLDERLLFELGDLLRTSIRSDEALATVSAKLGEYLEVSRCLFVEVDKPDGHARIRGDYRAGVPSLEGTQAISSWSPDGVAAARTGKTIINSDASVDERTAVRYETAFRPLDIRSYVSVPLLRNGRWVSTLLASSHRVRRWQSREVVLIQAVAERTWLWFEHLEALEGLRDREQHLGELNEALEHHGRLDISSTGGMTFRITFPLSDGAAPS